MRPGQSACSTIIFFISLFFTLNVTEVNAAARTVRVGVVEGGDHVWHVVIRQIIQEELSRGWPDSVEIALVPSGFVSGGWDREQFERQVEAVLARESLDVILAFGPWSVEAVMTAGFDKPIIAIHRFDPAAEQLIDSAGRPIADNLTVTAYRNRYTKDLAGLFALMKADKIGFLHFPSSDETDRIMERLTLLGAQADFDVVTAAGTNAVGTYAFFKSYALLDDDIDALYLAPTWGMSAELTGQFLAQVTRDSVPVFAAEGVFPVSRGAFAANSGTTATHEAMIAGWKLRQIVLEGLTPADLPVWWDAPEGLTVNEATATACGLVIDDFTAATSLLQAEPPNSPDLPLTLGEAISRALAINPGYLAGYEAIAAAGKAADAVRAEYYPHVQLDGRLGYVDDNRANNTAPTESNWQVEGVLSVYQRIYSPTAIRRQRLAAQRAATLEQAQYRSKLDLERAVAIAFVDIVAAEAQLAAALGRRQILDRFLEYELARAAIPTGEPVTGTARWQSEKSLIAREVLAARLSRERAAVTLNSLLGRPLATPVVVDARPFGPEAFQRDAMRARRMIGTAEQRQQMAASLATEVAATHPELQGLENERDQLAAGRSLARAGFLPEIGFQATLGVQDKLEDRAGFEEKAATWGAGLRLRWSLFDGGARGRQSASYDLETNRTNLLYDQARLRLDRDVTAQLGEVSMALFDGVLVGNALIDARAHVTTMARHPDTSIAVLLDAVQQFSEVDRAAVTARAMYYLTVIDLTHRLGWSLQENDALPNVLLFEAMEESQGGP